MINYKIVQRKNPKNFESPGKFYSQNIVSSRTPDTDVISKIASRSGHSVGQIQGIFADLETVVSELLADGQSIQLGRLGSLVVTFSASGMGTEEECNATLVSSVNVSLRPRRSTKRQYAKAELKFRKMKEIV